MLQRVTAMLASPAFIALLLLCVGCGMVVVGVHMLVGLAWALIAGAIPLLLVGGILMRGAAHGT